MRRASVPSVAKKLSHNGLGVCESVPEGVLASVPGSGPRDHPETEKGTQTKMTIEIRNGRGRGGHVEFIRKWVRTQ